jgi:SanA protein
VFIAGKYGMNAIAFNAKEVNAYDSFLTKFREQFARVKTIADIYFIGSKPRFLGEKICIG